MTGGDHDRQRAEFTRAAERVTGRRYCTACQSDMPLEGGVMKPMLGGRAHRFVCRLCAERMKIRAPSGMLKRKR